MKNILIIGDAGVLQPSVKEIMKPLGLGAITAEDGISGLRHTLLYHPKLIVISWNLPSLNGASLVKILQMLGLQIPCIFVVETVEEGKKCRAVQPDARVCLMQDLNERLLASAEEVLEAQKNQTFTDHKYSLNQFEMLDLLGSHKRKKILVVDDDEKMRRILGYQLSKTGLYEVYYAHDGRSGISKAMMIQPDLILSDIQMPMVNGIHMAQILYMIGMATPIIFITSFSDTETVERAKQLKAVRSYILKNRAMSQPDQLRAKILKILHISDEERREIQQDYLNYNLENLFDTGW